jgi:hypothetical protein
MRLVFYMNRSRGLFFVLFALTGLVLWVFAASWFDYNKMVSLPGLNAAPIGKAVTRFKLEKGKYPGSPQELVHSGYLPERATYYASYSLDKKIGSRMIRYSECELALDFNARPYPLAIVPEEHFRRYLVPSSKKRDVRVRLNF